jgi:hypothetical protein
MRSQILMLRALGEAYSKRADAAPSTSVTLRHHAIAHFEAADALEKQHRHELSLLTLAAGPAASGFLECTCQGGDDQPGGVKLRANDCPIHGLEDEEACS